MVPELKALILLRFGFERCGARLASRDRVLRSAFFDEVFAQLLGAATTTHCPDDQREENDDPSPRVHPPPPVDVAVWLLDVVWLLDPVWLVELAVLDPLVLAPPPPLVVVPAPPAVAVLLLEKLPVELPLTPDPDVDE